jgi:protein ImuA
MLGKTYHDLDSLRQRIAALESRPALAGVPISPERALHPSPLLPLPPGAVSEVFADQHRDAGAALGFALGLARGLVTPRRQAILVLQLADEAQETGVIYGHGLAHFGLMPDAVVLARPKTIMELLWAMEEAIACRAVAAVVADLGKLHKALDFTASRRLSLRAASAGSSAFLLRYLREREASAARFRWRLTPARSGPVPFDPRAPGPPRWRASLEKGRLAPDRPVSADGEDYLLEWTANGFVLADGDARPQGDAGTRQPALPRPRFAALGDRLSQTG